MASAKRNRCEYVRGGVAIGRQQFIRATKLHSTRFTIVHRVDKRWNGVET